MVQQIALYTNSFCFILHWALFQKECSLFKIGIVSLILFLISVWGLIFLVIVFPRYTASSHLGTGLPFWKVILLFWQVFTISKWMLICLKLHFLTMSSLHEHATNDYNERVIYRWLSYVVYDREQTNKQGTRQVNILETQTVEIALQIG